MLQKFNNALLCSTLESGFIKLHTFIWTSDSYATVVLYNNNTLTW